MTTYYLTATSQHLGGFYPSEPVTGDSRPATTGTDRWNADVFQTMGRSGMVASRGGDVLVYRRAVGVLLAQDDLENFQTWLADAATGKSIAFYHDRTQAWPGPSAEYEEYILEVGDDGLNYSPERVEPDNTIWHRAIVNMVKRVSPSP